MNQFSGLPVVVSPFLGFEHQDCIGHVIPYKLTKNRSVRVRKKLLWGTRKRHRVPKRIMGIVKKTDAVIFNGVLYCSPKAYEKIQQCGNDYLTTSD